MTKRLLNSAPDLTLFCAIVATLLVGKLFDAQQLISPPVNNIAGALLVTTGMSLSAAVLVVMIRGGGSTDVVKTSKRLITKGFFAVSRNPLYLAELITVLGVAVFVGTPTALVGPLVYFAVINFMVIPYEERNLESIFGQKYADYKKSTRRWL